MITCTTFADRLYGCTTFKQEDNYEKIIRKISMDSIKYYKQNSKDGESASIFKFLYEKFDTKSNNLCKILKLDRDNVQDIIISYAENISKLFNNYNLTYDNASYVYKHKIKGTIVGQIKLKDKMYNIDFSFRSISDTFYFLYYNKLNFFLYNQINNTKIDGIVYLPRDHNFYIIPYNPLDYTINKEFLDYNIHNRMVRPGHQCIYCSIRNCKPRLVRNIERFTI